MLGLLIVLFIVVPLAELWVIVQVSDVIGVPETLVLLLTISVLGGWLVKQQGLQAWMRLRRSVEEHRLPHRELLDGALILLAGALLLTPGFLTDLLGILLLLPPTRAAIRGVLARALRSRFQLVTVAASAADPGGTRVVDVDSRPPGARADAPRPPTGIDHR